MTNTEDEDRKTFYSFSALVLVTDVLLLYFFPATLPFIIKSNFILGGITIFSKLFNYFGDDQVENPEIISQADEAEEEISNDATQEAEEGTSIIDIINSWTDPVSEKLFGNSNNAPAENAEKPEASAKRFIEIDQETCFEPSFIDKAAENISYFYQNIVKESLSHLSNAIEAVGNFSYNTIYYAGYGAYSALEITSSAIVYVVTSSPAKALVNVLCLPFYIGYKAISYASSFLPSIDVKEYFYSVLSCIDEPGCVQEKFDYLIGQKTVENLGEDKIEEL